MNENKDVIRHEDTTVNLPTSSRAGQVTFETDGLFRQRRVLLGSGLAHFWTPDDKFTAEIPAYTNGAVPSASNVKDALDAILNGGAGMITGLTIGYVPVASAANYLIDSPISIILFDNGYELQEKFGNQTVEDDDTFNLFDASGYVYSGMLEVIIHYVGTDDRIYYGKFIFGKDGDGNYMIQMLTDTDAIFASSDTEGKFCLIYAVDASVLSMINRLGNDTCLFYKIRYTKKAIPV